MQKTWVSWITLALVLVVVLAPPTAAQARISRLELSIPSVAPGDEVRVSSDGCFPGEATVTVALLDADSQRALFTAAVESSNDARWAVTVVVPATVRPGSYPIVARCLGHGTYAGAGGDAYEGDAYEGDDAVVDAPGGGHTFEPAYVQVLPPATPPAADARLDLGAEEVIGGAATTVSGTGWDPGEQVTVAMYSEPVVLSHVRADATGSIEQRVTIPGSSMPGEHRVVAMNATSALHSPLTLDATLIVRAPDDAAPPPATPSSTPTPEVAGVTQETGALAFTGGNVLAAVLVGLALLLAGTVLRARR